MIVRHRSGPSDASRAAVAADFAEAVHSCALSLRQMVRAGHPYAMVPAALASPQVLAYALDQLIDEDGVPDGRFGNLCGAVSPLGESFEFTAAPVLFVCLRSWCPARFEGGDHGWPGTGPAVRAVEALALQVDPIARLERRALFAIEGPSAHPLLAGGMPSA